MKAFFARATLALALGLSFSGSALAADDEDEKAAAVEDEKPADEKKSEPAKGEDAEHDKKTDSAAGKDENPNFGHGKQFGLRVGLVGAYRMVLRYDKSPPCHEIDISKGNDQQKFCGYAAPFALDLALSGALIDSFEPFLWARLGLKGEEDSNTSPQLLLGVGARIYTTSDSKVKIFVEPALGLELDGKGDSKDPFRAAVEDKYYRTDLQFHLAAGPQFDLSKNFGLYLDAGLTLGILRYLHSTLELTAGIQGRVP
ncbi:MAG TPA: hypothetical protein VG937_38740 [Polyangiaceae bacterium]|nr:hypothetical protein [Polyangiaceae bacterium]